MDKQALQAQLAQVETSINSIKAASSALSPEQLQATLAPLQQKKAELEAQLAGVKSASVADGGAVAQGSGATAVGERGVNVGGSVGGSVITGDGSTVGGIQAHTIEAENVVSGTQIIGAQAAEAAELVELAKAMGSGSIKADSIKARNVVAGLQFIKDPTQATPDQLRQEVASLRQQLAAAIAAGEMENTADAQDVQAELAAAETELAQPEPHGSRVVRKLKAATEILTEGASMAQAAEKVGSAVIKLAPVAAAIYQIATNIFAR